MNSKSITFVDNNKCPIYLKIFQILNENKVTKKGSTLKNHYHKNENQCIALFQITKQINSSIQNIIKEQGSLIIRTNDPKFAELSGSFYGANLVIISDLK